MKLYITDDCISCGVCVATVPDFFVMKDDRAHVKKQPTTKEEKQECKEAMEGCPVDAIKKKIVQ